MPTGDPTQLDRNQEHAPGEVPLERHEDPKADDLVERDEAAPPVETPPVETPSIETPPVEAELATESVPPDEAPRPELPEVPPDASGPTGDPAS
jgi:hypothetical protein